MDYTTSAKVAIISQSNIFSIYFFSLFVGLGLEIHLLINPEKRSLACVCAYAPYRSFRLFAVTSVTPCGVIASLLIY